MRRARLAPPLRRVLLALVAAVSSAPVGAAVTGSATAVANLAQPLKLPVLAPIMDCAALRTADVSAAVGAPVRVDVAERVADGKPTPYCRVEVAIDNYARLELHLPTGWAQRLLFSGGLGAQSSPLLGSIVIATWQDLGNRGHEQVFATDYQNRINYGYRAMHLQVLAAKALIAKYYGRGPRYSYYNACSEPGREGMMEAQRYPEDFDGVGAGCPPLNETVNHGVFWSWNVLTNTGADGKPVITADKLPLLHETVLKQCDAADGARDGLVSEPLSCHPDLRAVECRAGSDPSACLTSEQVRVASELYRGAHDERGGRLEPIGALPGSELAWNQVIVFSEANNARLKTELVIKYLHSDPALPDSFNLANLKFDRATFDGITKLHGLYDPTDPDLSGFARAGHKLLLWQGLGDATVLPVYATLYYTALQKYMGAAAVERFARLYLLPGVAHCGGGDGPFIDDFLTPLMLWVERGVAPGALMATHGPAVQAPVARMTRPVYPYPRTAVYTGQGNVNDAANFVQGPSRPAPIAEWSIWFGQSFYQPGVLRWCAARGAAMECVKSR